jgi:hypothetical protein
MEAQQIINTLIGVVGALGGWWMRIMYQSLEELKVQDTKLAEKVSGIEVLVAGKYVTREDFEKKVDMLFSKLDKIDNKLDSKADKK